MGGTESGEKHEDKYSEVIIGLKNGTFNRIVFITGADFENFKPTKTHFLQGFLCQKNLVKRIYTQNVDGLELKVGVPEEKVVFAHGNITEAACPNCSIPVEVDTIKNYIAEGKVLYCNECQTPTKPKVVFLWRTITK